MSQHDDDRRWMEKAIDLSRKCPPSQTAFSVGAVIVDADGNEIANGYSRETDAHVHAEESALAKLADDDPHLAGSTIYSTLEPCSQRKSRPLSCTQLILTAGIPRVVIAWREPDLFVENVRSAESLVKAGVKVSTLTEYRRKSAEINKHLLSS